MEIARQAGLGDRAIERHLRQGTRDDVDKMYHYLIAEDISAVSQCLASGSVVQARDIALFAARMAPHYSYANYLAAMTIYTIVRVA